ncbi:MULTISPECIES: hypothetical protein [unclassified Kitasatospora]|uniref:hypothetical protein n=1 Tax=unclassified Kitasatospora TaxID=2633591 RepID=UPI0033BFDD1A
MTATNDAPDPLTTQGRWQHIEDRLTAIERRIREHSSAAIATIDTCLAGLDALRHDLAHWPRPPQAAPAPPAVPPQGPPGSPPAPAGHHHTPTAPGGPQDSPAQGQAIVREPA